LIAWSPRLGLGVAGSNTDFSFVLSPATTNAAKKDIRHMTPNKQIQHCTPYDQHLAPLSLWPWRNRERDCFVFRPLASHHEGCGGADVDARYEDCQRHTIAHITLLIAWYRIGAAGSDAASSLAFPLATTNAVAQKKKIYGIRPYKQM